MILKAGLFVAAVIGALMVFPYLNNSKMAAQWGPWIEEDPEAQMSYSGPNDGVGSKASWTGGKKLGIGSATIMESVPNERVKVQLVYEAPVNMTQEAWRY